MKKSLIALSALLSFATFAPAQEVKIGDPISEVILSESPAAGTEQIVITLQPPEASGASVPSDDFEVRDCSLREGGVAIKSRQATFLPDTEKMKWICEIPLGASTTGRTMNQAWSSFKLAINYRMRQEGAWQPIVSVPIAIPFTRCIRVPGVEVAFGSEKRTGEAEVTIPIQLNADLRVQVEMLDPSNRQVARVDAGSVFVPRQDGTKFTDVILRKVDDDTLVFSTASNYRIVVKPIQSQSSIPFKNNEKTNVRLKDFKNYSIRDTDIKALGNLAPKLDGSLPISFITTDRGDIRLFVNSSKEPLLSSAQTSHSFQIPSSALNDGANTIRLEGESSEGIKLSDRTTFSFVKESKTYLDKSTVAFSLDEKDILTITYKLSRPLENRWQFVDSSGNAGLGADATPVGSNSSEYKAVINLAVQDQSFVDLITKELKGETIKRAPITIQIVNAKDGKDVVGAFTFDFLKPNAELVKKMQNVIEMVKAGQEKKAKPVLTEALGPGTQAATVDSIIQLFQSKQDSSSGGTKNIIYTALRIAGKIGAAFFGIPLPI